jgi:deazaflavin-dependent oxidoreductase (nitroreductase family)
MDWSKLNPSVIEEFRANGGKVAQFGDLPVVILHTLGARSGKLRLVPLIAVVDGDETLLFGTNAGSDRMPVWVHNLRAHPRITVERGSERFTADVVELPEDERQRRVQQQQAVPQFAQYVESAAPRPIPVFAIRPA